MTPSEKNSAKAGNVCDVLLLFVNDIERGAVFDAARKCDLTPRLDGQGIMTSPLKVVIPKRVTY